MQDSTLEYVIDSSDNITHISGEWDQFAASNKAPQLLVDNLINRPLFQFVSGERVKYIYNLLFAKVRSNRQTVSFPFRCDSPDLKRYLELTITPGHAASLKLISKVLHTVPRESISLLDVDSNRSNYYLTICSFCKKVQKQGNIWVDMEEIVKDTNFFQSAELPRLSHGICNQCSAEMLRLAKESKTKADMPG